MYHHGIFFLSDPHLQIHPSGELCCLTFIYLFLSSLITEVAVAAMSVALQGMLADESITIDSLCSGRLF